MNPIKAATVPYYALFVAVAVGVCAAFFAWYPICDGDIFWHLATGREIVKNLAVPAVDPFSYTSGNGTWIDLHWLYQLAMYGVHALAGTGGLLLVNSLLFGAAAAIAFAVAGNTKKWWALAPLWIAALYEVRYLVPHRPVAFTLLFMAVFIMCLERFSRSGRFRYLLALVPVQILWANSQGLFLMGPAIFAAYFAGEAASWALFKLSGGFFSHAPRYSSKTVIIVVLTGCTLIAASLVNPYGVQALSLAAGLFERLDPSLANLYSANIAENTPLIRLAAAGQGRYAYAVGAVTLIALILCAVRYRTVRLSLCFVSLAMLVLAIRAQRNIVLYFFAILPLISALVSETGGIVPKVNTRRTQRFVFAARGVFALLAFAGLLSHAAMLRSIRGVGGVSPFSFPRQSIEYLRSHPHEGAIFNADRYGGYLLWSLFPGQKVFVDTRYIIRPPEFFAAYLAMLDNPALFEQARRKFSITAAVLPTALTDRYYTLARALCNDPAWRLAFADGAEALFIRDQQGEVQNLALDSDKTVDSLIQHTLTRWGGNPALKREAMQHLEAFLSAMGFSQSAKRVATAGGLTAE